MKLKFLESLRRQRSLDIFCPVLEQKQTALFRYKFGYVRKGVTHWVTPWRSNLILDSGLNKVATALWQNCWTTMLLGNQVAPDPVSRNGGGVTFSQATTVITASGGFFVAADTGRLFKFDSGEECYLTYVSATVATASISRTVGSGPGTVWYVNQTALQAPFYTTATYDTTGGANGTSAVSNVITYKRTFLGAAVGANYTATEIGFSNSGTNTNIFDRDIIVGGVSLLTGDQPTSVVQLIVTFTPTTSTAVGNVATGYDSSGNVIISGLNYASSLGGISYINSAGATVGGDNAFEPFTLGTYPFRFITASFSMPSFSNGVGPSYTGVDPTTVTNQAYTNGNFYRDLDASINTATGNGTIYGFCAGPINQAVWVQRLTTPFAKTSLQTLSCTFRKSWQRILVN